MQCNELIEQLSEYLDCSLYVDSVKKTIVIAQSGSAPPIPLTVSDQLQAALTRAYTARASVSTD